VAAACGCRVLTTGSDGIGLTGVLRSCSRLLISEGQTANFDVVCELEGWPQRPAGQGWDLARNYLVFRRGLVELGSRMEGFVCCVRVPHSSRN
jgi:hypothetical protein